MSNQRAGKTHKAVLSDGDKIPLRDLIKFCRQAENDLASDGQGDAALCFELLADWLQNDFRGRLEYRSRIIGL